MDPSVPALVLQIIRHAFAKVEVLTTSIVTLVKMPFAKEGKYV
jgi:hypothetical protein